MALGGNGGRIDGLDEPVALPYADDLAGVRKTGGLLEGRSHGLVVKRG
jgi:hypothetical protein